MLLVTPHGFMGCGLVEGRFTALEPADPEWPRFKIGMAAPARQHHPRCHDRARIGESSLVKAC